MYLGREILMFSPLLLYAGVRIGSLLRGTGTRIAWAAVFLLLGGGYPAAEALEHRAAGVPAQVLSTLGYAALPFLLYLVTAVLAVDLLTGLARLGGLLSREKLRRPGSRRVRLGLMLLVPAAFTAFGAWNFNRLEIREYRVVLPRKSAKTERLTIVFAADFHLQARTPRRIMERFADKVNALEPDLVLIGGDIVEGGNTPDEKLEHEAAQFRRLRSAYGVYGVLGNHDSFGGDRSSFFEKAGLRMLRDEYVRIDASIYLAGRLDGRRRTADGGGRKSIDDLLAPVPGDLPIILLDHRPTDLENLGRSRADLQLSGHTHNAQVFPLNFIARKEYEIPWGYGVKGRSQVIVTTGVQGWGPPVRTAGASEIVVVRVTFQ
ncbi:MAG: metallophosphoesterase [Acidobacteriota bacterium]|nr:metallophosphoesterase [Acidobacteriota bacterium]OQB57404.1 MAG: putative metallophosphoesterase [Candidatus Aminicenantes bacterium ADurb.Bin147]HNT32569.1 metallophosphoesterase [Candidatus Aminicenantes bacterium]MDW3227776.1 metallophosphoesterase [Acidobacteriota bacterium]HOF82876.1 metallophosphoesterase [Candidatus Aminicenantes bacterium]